MSKSMTPVFDELCLERTPLGSAKRYNPVPEKVQMIIQVKTERCMVCGKSSLIDMTEEQYDRLKQGAKAKDVFPDKDPDFWELCITGTHPKCWDEAFGDEESWDV